MGSKLTLIFDFNNIAMRALFTCGYAGAGSISTFNTDEECNILVRKIAMDMSYIMRLFDPDRTIVLCDAKLPWRKELYKDSTEDYKGNRVKDDTKNWDKIWSALSEYKNLLKQKGFIISEISNAEADDLAALWKHEIFEVNGNDIVFVSSDADWVQLIDYNSVSSKFCLVFNPIADNKKHKKLFATKDFIYWLNDTKSSGKVDIFFNNYNPQKEKFKNIILQDDKIAYIEEDPQSIVLNKIMCGDDGDNVPAFYSYYKNGKRTRITTSKAKAIFEDLNIHSVKDLCQVNEANALKPAIEKAMKKEIDDIDLNERMIRQRRLVELIPILFPEDINTAFKYHYENSADNGYVPVRNMTLKELLADSKFLTENPNKPKENTIFDNIKDLEKYIKPLNKNLF